MDICVEKWLSKYQFVSGTLLLMLHLYLLESCVIKIEAKVFARFRDSFDVWRSLGL